MTNYRATVTVEIERSGGNWTHVTEIVRRNAGDNPRFERSEAEETIHQAMRQALNRVAPLD